MHQTEQLGKTEYLLITFESSVHFERWNLNKERWVRRPNRSHLGEEIVFWSAGKREVAALDPDSQRGWRGWAGWEGTLSKSGGHNQG